jgi:hypothetical protein
MKTAWYNKKNITNAMVASNFGKLEDSDHFSSFKQCLNKLIEIESKKYSILDLGCGAGELGRVMSDHDYTGADLPHVIDKVAKIKNPQNNYFYFDANENSFDFLKNYDIIIMNSFLSEVPNWYVILSKILLNAKKFIIIHRQDMTEKNSFLRDYKTYGGLTTINTFINISDFEKLITFNNFKINLNINSFKNNNTKKTFLLSKKEC